MTARIAAIQSNGLFEIFMEARKRPESWLSRPATLGGGVASLVVPAAKNQWFRYFERSRAHRLAKIANKSTVIAGLYAPVIYINAAIEAHPT